MKVEKTYVLGSKEAAQVGSVLGHTDELHHGHVVLKGYFNFRRL